MLGEVIEPHVIPEFVPPDIPPPPEPPAPWAYEVKNLKQFKDGAIDCEVLHEVYGWIPFTAVPGDDAPATVAVFNYIEEYSVDVGALPVSPAIAVHAEHAERLWRDQELTVADVELLKAEDGDPAFVSTPAQWRQYRVDLRNWPQSPDFPDSTLRPVRPTA